MPLCTLHLLSLTTSTDLPHLLTHIHSFSYTSPSDNPIITLARPIRWIITPTTLDAEALLSTDWHLLLVLKSTRPARNLITSLLTAKSQPDKFEIVNHYYLSTGVPSRLLDKYSTKPSKTTISTSDHWNPSALSTQTTKTNTPSPEFILTPALSSWLATNPVSGPVNMLNLLAFAPGKRDSYLAYSAQFTSLHGAKRGAVPRLVGAVIRSTDENANKAANKTTNTSTKLELPSAAAAAATARSLLTATGDATEQRQDRQQKEKAKEEWDEIALVEYPSLSDFAAMLGDAEYQVSNRELRVPALRDTGILCAVEVDLNGAWQKEGGGGSERRNDNGKSKTTGDLQKKKDSDGNGARDRRTGDKDGKIERGSKL